MPVIIADNSFTEDDWKEAVDNYSPRQFTVSRQRSYATLTGWIEPSKVNACVTYLLGYATPDTSLKLKRRTPSWHPVFPWLSCTQITDIVGVKFDGKEENIYLGLLDFAVYEKVKITAAFEQLPWKVKEDYQITNEYERWTVIRPKPYVQQFAVEGGSLVFEAAGKSWDGKPILSTRPLVRQSKTALKVDWMEVPWSFVADTNDVMVHFLDAMGCVNTNALWGRPAGTLLFDDCEVEKYIQPVATQTIGDYEFSANIFMTFKYFDPPRGLGTETRRGWNLWPAVDGKFYWAKDPVNGQPIFSSFAHEKLFQRYNT